MAGVKGRSGGARKNTGGARPGAGRKPKPRPEPLPIEDAGKDMLELLQKIALGHIDATPIQVRAAVAAVQYTHAKADVAGKKSQRKAAAADVAGGKFTASAPPKLSVVK